MTNYRIPKGPIPHGTANGYSNYRCRCLQCREAWRVRCAEVTERKRERGICIECGQVAEHGLRCDKHRKALNERRQVCACGHCRLHHGPVCRKCGCAGFLKAARKAGRRWAVLTAEQKQEALAKMRDTLKERWLVRFPGVDPEIAKAIYREGYQAGHQRARDAAARQRAVA